MNRNGSLLVKKHSAGNTVVWPYTYIAKSNKYDYTPVNLAQEQMRRRVQAGLVRLRSHG